MRQALRHAGQLFRNCISHCSATSGEAARPAARPSWRRQGRREAQALSAPARPSRGLSAGPPGPRQSSPLQGVRRRRAASACSASVRVQEPLCDRDAAHEARPTRSATRTPVLFACQMPPGGKRRAVEEKRLQLSATPARPQVASSELVAWIDAAKDEIRSIGCAAPPPADATRKDAPPALHPEALYSLPPSSLALGPTSSPSARDSLERLDNGPAEADLRQELEWLLEDLVAGSADGPADARRGQGAPGHPPKAASAAKPAGRAPWRLLRTELRGHDSPGRLALRASLGEARELWRRRVHDRVPFQYVTVRTRASGPSAPHLRSVVCRPCHRACPALVHGGGAVRGPATRRIGALQGAAHWLDLVLAVGPGVLIPRPETETLVELASEALAARAPGRSAPSTRPGPVRAAAHPAPRGGPETGNPILPNSVPQRDPSLAQGRWADLGTGSGALAVALARLLRSRRAGPAPGGGPEVTAVDISEAAVAYARANARRGGVEGAAGA